MSAQFSRSLWNARRLICACLVLFCLLIGQGVHCDEQDDDSRITITYDIGKNAEFTCTVRNLGRRKLIWRRLSDPYPISVGSTRFTPDKRYSTSRLSSSSYKLSIRDVGVKDAGEYECRVTGAEDLAEVITLNVKGGEKRPFLMQTDTEIKANEGDSVILPCEVANLNNKMVLWKNDRNEVISLRRKNHIGDRRFRVVHDTAPQWSLSIEKVQDPDFGYYTCVINSNPVLTRTVHLKRTVAPEMSPKLLRDTHYRTEVRVKSGETATLICNFQANPPAKVSWYRRIREGGETTKEMLGEGSSLTLRAVSTEQSGTYFCVGKNGLKPFGRGRTRLVVMEPPTTVPPITTTTVLVPTGPVSPHMYTPMGSQVSSRRGREVVLTCSTIGSPRPYIHWFFHGKRLRDDHKYKIDDKTYERYNSTSTLTIRSVSTRDFGKYECNGYNQLGIKAVDLELSLEN